MYAYNGSAVLWLTEEEAAALQELLEREAPEYAPKVKALEAPSFPLPGRPEVSPPRLPEPQPSSDGRVLRLTRARLAKLSEEQGSSANLRSRRSRSPRFHVRLPAQNRPRRDKFGRFQAGGGQRSCLSAASSDDRRARRRREFGESLRIAARAKRQPASPPASPGECNGEDSVEVPFQTSDAEGPPLAPSPRNSPPRRASSASPAPRRRLVRKTAVATLAYEQGADAPLQAEL